MNRIIRWWRDFVCFIDWHYKIQGRGFDGCSPIGRCSWCNHKVLKDGQGNWFSIERDKPRAHGGQI